MRLKTVTLLAIISICYVFALRLVGTFFSTVFRNLLAIKITGTISLLATFSMIIFFLYFYKDYVRKEQTALKMVTVLVILVFLAGIVTQMSSVARMFEVHMSGYPVVIHSLDVIVHPLTAIFMLIFFIVFYKEIYSAEPVSLRKATLFAIIGTSVLTVLQSFVLFNYFYYLQSGIPWLYQETKIITLLMGIPIIVFSFLASVIFFYN